MNIFLFTVNWMLLQRLRQRYWLLRQAEDWKRWYFCGVRFFFLVRGKLRRGLLVVVYYKKMLWVFFSVRMFDWVASLVNFFRVIVGIRIRQRVGFKTCRLLRGVIGRFCFLYFVLVQFSIVLKIIVFLVLRVFRVTMIFSVCQLILQKFSDFRVILVCVLMIFQQRWVSSGFLNSRFWDSRIQVFLVFRFVFRKLIYVFVNVGIMYFLVAQRVVSIVSVFRSISLLYMYLDRVGIILQVVWGILGIQGLGDNFIISFCGFFF